MVGNQIKSDHRLPITDHRSPATVEVAYLIEVADKHLYTTRCLSPVIVLIRGMIAVFGEAEAEEDNWRFEIFLHRDARSYRPAFACKRRCLAKGVFHSIPCRVCVRAFELAKI